MSADAASGPRVLRDKERTMNVCYCHGGHHLRVGSLLGERERERECECERVYVQVWMYKCVVGKK